MVFNGPRVYGSLGALNLNASTKLSEYTPNALAGYFYDATEPHLAQVPTKATLPVTPDAYPLGLDVKVSTTILTSGTREFVPICVTVDGTSGLLTGGLIELTGNYVLPPVGPAFAALKPSLACTTAGVVIQKRDILPGFTWTPNVLGGYVGFLYRGKNGPLEPAKNVLGNGTPETAILGTKVTPRIEPFRMEVTDQD
jgi:hypothetical protein